VIWRETSLQHFKNGKWSEWYKKDSCQPLQNMSNPWEDVLIYANNYGIKVLEIWNMSAFAWFEHLSNKTKHVKSNGNDCTHFCEPRIVDMWSKRLWYMIMDKKRLY